MLTGGWDGHQPVEVGAYLAEMLRAKNVQVLVSDTLDPLDDERLLESMDLIVPCWTMGKLTGEQSSKLAEAVRGGVAMAGLHGGMGDAFREDSEYNFIVGGQFVAHPGNDGRHYDVAISPSSMLLQGFADFEVSSEKYYMHVDPAIRVHAYTFFEDYDQTPMPVVWTKAYGQGRVFYCSLGHSLAIVEGPESTEIMSRGFDWALGKGPMEDGVRLGSLYV